MSAKKIPLVVAAGRLDSQLPRRPGAAFCTDFCRPYGKIFEGQDHLKGKAYTFTIVSWNNRARIYLARLGTKSPLNAEEPKKSRET